MSSIRQKTWKQMAMSSMGLVLVAIVTVVACTDKSSAKPKYTIKKAPRPDLVAKIDGKEITEDELIGDAQLELLDLKKKIYELKMRRMKEVVLEKLVGAKAKEAGMSMDEYLDKKVTAGKLKVSTADFNKFLKDRGLKKDQVNDQIRERINAFLKEGKKEQVVDNYVSSLTRKHPVEVYFSKPRMDAKINIEGAPTWGKDDAPVTIVEFSDFQCPYCKKAAITMKEIKKKYKGKVKVAFKHFPLPMHREAGPASEASMCVKEQDQGKFWKYYDIVFNNQTKLDNASLIEYAERVGADKAKFEACFNGKKYASFVKGDLKYGERLGVRSTPTFIINGELINGARSFDDFAAVIDEALESAKN